MSGKHKGFEKLLRDKVLHLLDVNGDVCHHFHNTVKQFCKTFVNFVEKLINDIHWDTNIVFIVICFLLNVPLRKPPKRVSHRWLSVFDCLSVDMELLNPLILL